MRHVTSAAALVSFKAALLAACAPVTPMADLPPAPGTKDFAAIAPALLDIAIQR